MEVSKDEAQRLKFWSGRKNAFPAIGPHQPRLHVHGLTIPRKRLADILLAIQQMEKKYGLRCCNVFHAGDGNLHPLILFDANDPDQLHRCELFGADILETSVRAGRHRHRRAWRGRREAQLHVRAVQRPKSASRCSPSSAPSTRRACSTRARSSRRCSAAPSTASMHVKKGLLPFPELERF